MYNNLESEENLASCILNDITNNVNKLINNLNIDNDLFNYKLSKILAASLNLNNDIIDLIDEIPDIISLNQDEINKNLRNYREYDEIHENMINDITPLMLYYQIISKK